MNGFAFTLVAEGDEFSAKEITKAIKYSFLHYGGTECTSIGGGGRSKNFWCTGRRVDKKTKKETGCKARILARRSTKNPNIWCIVKVYLVHNECPHEQEKASLVAVEDHIGVIVRANPGITGPEIVKYMKTARGINVGCKTAFRAKCKALGRTAESNRDGFKVLQSLLDQLGSTKGVHTDVEWEKAGFFKRCFVMLPGGVKVATRSPNKAVSLDGSHLSGVFKGVILTITTMDANNRINIVAFAVVRRENEKSYKYLLTQAKKSKQITKFLNNKTTTCFTDGQNGVDAAVAELMPLAALQNCLEHLLREAGRVGKVGKQHAYSAAKSTTKAMFDNFMGLLRGVDPDVHDKLNAVSHKLWAHYAGRKDVCWGQVTTNSAESANSLLLELRRLPVYYLVRGTILLMTKRLYDASELKKDDLEQISTPFATEHFKKAIELSRTLTTEPLGDPVFLVSDGKVGSPQQYRTSVVWTTSKSGTPPPTFECSCGVPQKMQLPCSHVVATVQAQKRMKESLSLVNKRFKLTRYRRLATHPINLPVWDELKKDPSKKPPRMVKRLDGKAISTKRTTRIRSTGEERARKKRKTR